MQPNFSKCFRFYFTFSHIWGTIKHGYDPYEKSGKELIDIEKIELSNSHFFYQGSSSACAFPSLIRYLNPISSYKLAMSRNTITYSVKTMCAALNIISYPDCQFFLIKLTIISKVPNKLSVCSFVYRIRDVSIWLVRFGMAKNSKIR